MPRMRALYVTQAMRAKTASMNSERGEAFAAFVSSEGGKQQYRYDRDKSHNNYPPAAGYREPRSSESRSRSGAVADVKH